jgi:plastocyanin
MIAVLVIAVTGIIIWRWKSQETPYLHAGPEVQSSNTPQSSSNAQFSTPKKSAHYETNTPAHGTTLAGVPINIVIDFNFDLAKPSEIKILKDGQDFGVGETVIDNNKLSMRRTMNPGSPDGKYQVMYNACWPDTSCHDGSFEFAIDRELAKDFGDRTKSNEVTINLSNSQFEPKNLKIKKGTKVTWINDDSVEHYINTDSHPAHTYFLSQNSRALQGGGTYSITFDTPGIYPYHCSAHEATMKGNILVED